MRLVYFLSTGFLFYLAVGGWQSQINELKPTHQEIPAINIWYGDHQHFGELGQPQRWINILGNVSNSEMVDSAYYVLNKGVHYGLSLGCDLHRLAAVGDFNVELSWEELFEGTNDLMISIIPPNGEHLHKMVVIEVSKGERWPLPYEVDFQEVTNLQDVVQVVDGYWNLETEGVRAVVPYYDRVLTMGDTSWKNFETIVHLTVHGWTPSQPGPPTYNVSHFGVAMRWRGHHSDARQPSRRWYPLGAQGEFLLKETPDSCRWRILFDGTPKQKEPMYTDKRNTLLVGEPLLVKTQVITMRDGRSRYRFKQWMEGKEEPVAWDVEGFEKDDYPSGALCLVPHNSDVTIHKVAVRSINHLID